MSEISELLLLRKSHVTRGLTVALGHIIVGAFYIHFYLIAHNHSPSYICQWLFSFFFSFDYEKKIKLH